MIKNFKQFILEEIDTTGTYLSAEKSAEKSKKDLFDSFIRDRGIEIKNLEIGSEVYKKLILSFKEKNPALFKLFTRYLKELKNTKTKTKSIIDYNPEDIKFEFKKRLKQGNITQKNPEDIYKVILPESIKRHIINNPDTNGLDHLIYISCESTNFNKFHFAGRLDRRRLYPIDKSGTKRDQMSYGTEYYGKSFDNSYSNLLNGLPSSVKGTGIGYQIFKQFTNYLGYGSSTNQSSTEALRVFNKLCNDNDIASLIINGGEKNGAQLFFSKNFKGDFKKISKEFIEKYKREFQEEQVEIISIVIDDFLKGKGVNLE
jgi:hypothetical protein